MPTLSTFLGIAISMMYADTGRHGKPHVHVRYGEYRASVSLDGELLAGSLPIKQMNLVLGWLALREGELMAAWNRAVNDLPPGKIEPLK
jgi:hypothetical protein